MTMTHPKRTPNFKKDLKIGADGEATFQRRFQVAITKESGKGRDFTVSNKVGSGLELKTDTYDSKNFFFERWSDVTNQKPGGPWQANAHSKYLAYYFVNKNIYYLFDLATLVPFLEKYIAEKKPRPIEVRNRKYTTVGYALPIADFEHLALHYSSLNGLTNPEPEEGYIPCGGKNQRTKN